MNDAGSRTADQPFLVEELLRIYEASQLGLGVIDAQLRLIRVNERLASLTGLPVEALAGRRLDEAMPTLHQRLESSVGSALAGRPIRGLAISNPNGETMPGQGWLVDLLPLDDGRRLGVALIVDEVSDRRFEVRLRQEREALNRLADAMPVIVLVLDRKLQLRFANRPWYDFVGCTNPDEEAAPPFVEITHGDDLARVQALFEDAARPEEKASCEARLRRADGRYRWHLVEAQQTGSELGATWEALVTCVEIEEQRRIQADLAEKSSRLEEEDRRKDHFLAVLGHEIRNPLSAMANAVTTLGLGQDPDWALDVMREQMKMLSQLVDDLLDDARIRQGKIDLRRVPMDLVRVLRLSLETLRETARESEVSLVLDAADDGIPLFADKTRLQQVFTNLVRNAVKFSEPGGTVTMTVRHSSNPEGFVRVCVEDEGKGIPPEMIERIFDPFVQLGATDRYPDRGLGVGLSLVRDLVRLHDGSVVAASPGEGMGASFTVTLPLTDPVSEAETGEVPLVTDGQEPESVLIVDDNVAGRSGLARVLAAYGLTVTEAGCAADAVTAFRAAAADVCILDIGLPDRSGHELAEELRACPGGQETRLIALSGYARDCERHQSAFDAHMLKPVDLPELLELMGLGD